MIMNLYMRSWWICILLALWFSPSFATQATASPRYDYRLDDEGKKKLLQGLRNVVVGDAKEKVARDLGLPSSKADLYDKKGAFRYTVWRYDIARVQLGTSNRFDQVVTVYFNREGRVVRLLKPQGDAS